jgi:SAM-dependent methyltransferase
MASEDLWTAPSKLQISEEFRRGIIGIDYRRRSKELIGWMIEELGVSDLSANSVLDIGCGVNFTEAFYGLGVPVKRYHGVEVAPTMVKFLQAHVNAERFSYKYISISNERYHSWAGKPLGADTDIGVPSEKFDVICLCSVFTHLAPDDYQVMLHLTRRYVAPGGTLFFTSFLDDAIEGDFVDHKPDLPLWMAVYREEAVRRYAANARWSVEKVYSVTKPRQSRIVCKPA